MTNPTPRPLEVLVVERVLGWSVCDLDHSNRHEAHNCTAKVLYRDQAAATPSSRSGWFIEPEGKREHLAPYLNSWAGLGLVVEAMEGKGLACLWNSTRSSAQVIFGPTNCLRSRFDAEKGVGEDASRFRAVQLAALRALGVDEETIQRAVEATDSQATTNQGETP